MKTRSDAGGGGARRRPQCCPMGMTKPCAIIEIRKRQIRKQRISESTFLGNFNTDQEIPLEIPPLEPRSLLVSHPPQSTLLPYKEEQGQLLLRTAHPFATTLTILLILLLVILLIVVVVIVIVIITITTTNNNT